MHPNHLRPMILAMLCGGVLLVSCAPKAPPPPPPPPPPAMVPPPETSVTYSCTDGQQRTVRYFPNQGVAVLVENGQNRELQLQGELFVAPGVIVRPNADKLRMTISQGDRSANCTAAN